MRGWSCVLAAVLLAGVLAPVRAEEVAEPSDYRQDDFRAPVPDTLAGATVVDTAAAKVLWEAGETVFIDVLPMPPKPKLPPSTIFRQPPRDDIPGSTWLPDVGYGRLNETMTGYFRDGLAAATGGDKSKPVLFYCLADCWMSWNAARRALEWGYRTVYWYPDGTDGWTFDDLPVERRKPVPRPEEEPDEELGAE
jgi:PQQ-dependent catabolism-associated CXXCW motif protein